MCKVDSQLRYARIKMLSEKKDKEKTAFGNIHK